MVQALKWATAHLSIRRGAQAGHWVLGCWARGCWASEEQARGTGGAGARQGGHRRKAQRAGARARRYDTACWAATTRPLRAPGRACAHLGMLAGLCVHTVHLTSF